MFGSLNICKWAAHFFRGNKPARHIAENHFSQTSRLLFIGSCILGTFLFFSTSAWAFQWREVQINGRKSVPIADVARFYGMKLQTSGGQFSLTAPPRQSILGHAGRKEVKINGVKYSLCFPTISSGGTIYISAMDVKKIIEPVIRPMKIKGATAVTTIVLDAGHGGHDNGAMGRGGREKEATLDVVRRAGQMLRSRGYKVVFTRTDDVFIPLAQRVSMASRNSNALFVSVHFNDTSSNRESASGLETYCLAPRGVPSMAERDDYGGYGYSDLKFYPGHRKDEENMLLASAVHASMVSRCRLPDRGIKRARFHVLRNNTIPAILIEGGFIQRDGDSIKDSNYRQAVAASIVEGIERFRGSVVGRYSGGARPHVSRGTGNSTSGHLMGTYDPEKKVGEATPDTSSYKAMNSLFPDRRVSPTAAITSDGQKGKVEEKPAVKSSKTNKGKSKPSGKSTTKKSTSAKKSTSKKR